MGDLRMLTDMAIKKAKPAEKAFRLADNGGLFLLVTPPQAASCGAFAIASRGRNRPFRLGTYPDVGFAEARSVRDEAKVTLRVGEEPRHRSRSCRRACPSGKQTRTPSKRWPESGSP